MALTYAAAPQHVVTDKSGNVKQGIRLEVWTAEGGTQITALYDVSGNMLPGYLTTDDEGRYRFMLKSNSYPTVWIRDPEGDWWQIDADQSIGAGLEALIKADAALDLATETAHALGEICIMVDGRYASQDQMDGTADATSAWQAAIDTGASRIVFPAGSRWWFDGSKYVQLRSHLEIDLMGTTVVKTNGNGYYNVLNAPSAGTGWGNGVTDVVIRNGLLRGNLANGGSVALLTAHHAARFTIENMEFVGCMIGGHLLDLAGCEDFTIRDIIMRGWKVPASTTTPRHEAIQLDQSLKGTGSPDPAGTFDGLLCRRITIENITATSWTDPADSTWYPAPNPVGAHSYREGQWYEDITISNVLVIDPVVDQWATNIAAQDATIRGIIHFPTIKRLRMSNIRVVAKDGLGCNRAIMIQSRASGTLASGNPNNETTSGDWAAPQGCEDIWIENVSIHGMLGTDSAINPLIALLGCDGAPVRGATIELVTDGAYKEAVFLNRCADVTVDVHCAAAESGVRIINSRRITTGGSFTDVRLPIRQDNSFFVSVDGAQGEHTTGAVNFVYLSNGSDYLAVTNVLVTGWTSLVNTAPTNYAEAGCIPTALAA